MEAGGWLLPPDGPAFRTLVSRGNFARGAAHHAARRSGAKYQDAALPTRRGAPLPRPLEATWLRERKRAIEITWPFEAVYELGVPFPLTRAPFAHEWVSFAYRLQWSRHLLEVVAENVTATSPTCACGSSLALAPASSIENAVGPFLFAHWTTCRTCGAPFDPSRSVARVEDVLTGERRLVAGGALYRFALVVDCGKTFPESGAPCSLHPELLGLLESVIGCRFEQIGIVC